MKYKPVIMLLSMLFYSFSVFAQTLNENQKSDLKKDKYGMSPYVFGLLSNGNHRISNKDSLKILQNQHLKNILKLEKEGKIIVAGPFYNTESVRGIFVYNTDSINLAREWAYSDPMIQSGHLKIELYPWYSSAVLQLVPSLHEEIEEVSITE